MTRALCLLALIGATGAQALDLPGNARLTLERISPQDRYDAPIAVFDGERIPVLPIEGQVRRQAWLVPGAGLTPLQILAPVRAQLEAQGYEVQLDCNAEACGGFDFRFGTEVLPAPGMFVNLRNFQFLTMTRGAAEAPEAVTTVMVSTTRDAGYVQIVEAIRVAARDTGARATQDDPGSTTTQPSFLTSGDLLTQGFVVLEGVSFSSGETELGEAEIASIRALADTLTQNPGLRIALVGHTDSVGSLDGNISISRTRAQSVRARLIDRYGIAPDRIEAEGMGYLAPRASNLTQEGREANRRVEAIVLSNE